MGEVFYLMELNFCMNSLSCTVVWCWPVSTVETECHLFYEALSKTDYKSSNINSKITGKLLIWKGHGRKSTIMTKFGLLSRHLCKGTE
jgi:hypothetical protein